MFCWMKEQIFNMTPLYLMEGRQGDTDPVCVEQGWGVGLTLTRVKPTLLKGEERLLPSPQSHF